MKKVIIALPGRTFSGAFMCNMIDAIHVMKSRGYGVSIVNDHSSFVPFARMKTLGLDVLRGKDQKPFGGQVNYDVWVTIDSDIIFTPEQLIQLVEDTDTYPVISGIYMMQDGKHFAMVEHWDEEYFKEHGSFQFMTRDDIEGEYMKVSYNGMGFFACKKGVIEALEYPYFSYPLQEIILNDGTIVRDMCSEDVSFCKNLNNAGFDIVINTNLRVGHEKTVVL